MASGGRDLSTRMSAEDENTENKRIKDIALAYFKRYKVDISGAINKTFPFLNLLHDHDFITEEMYNKSLESLIKRSTIHEVIYDVLSELEKNFDMSLFGALFNKTIMKTYPDLFRIYKKFYKVIPDIEFLLESDGEENVDRPNEQLSLEQGTGETSYQSLTWFGPDACNYNDTVPPERGPSEHRHEAQAINATETGTTSDNRDALGSQQANEQCAQQSKTAGAEVLHHGNQINFCSVDLVHIKKEKTFLNSGVKFEARARTDYNNASDSIVISSQDLTEFTDGDGSSEASTSALKTKTVPSDFRKSHAAEKILCKTGIREHVDVNVVFDAEILPVTCREMKGILIKRKFERESMMKCIRSQDGNWFTLHEFELKGGYKTCNWKNNVRCYGKTLKWLMEKKCLPKPPRTYGKIKKPENAEKCKICGDEGMLFKCSWCLGFFHGDCHIPPVDPKRKSWRCTFCTIEESSQSLQCYSESEVLERWMGSKEKLKCEFLLLKAYCHFETIIFLNIPHQNYAQKVSQCLETLRTLDEIKNKLNGGCYTKVEEFVFGMNNIFQDPKHNNSDLIKEEFKKNFKEVFAIQ